jgi:hypothetical protein
MPYFLDKAVTIVDASSATLCNIVDAIADDRPSEFSNNSSIADDRSIGIWYLLLRLLAMVWLQTAYGQKNLNINSID